MSLTPREERLVRLSAAIALGRGDVLAELRRTVPEGEPDRGWREAVLQAHLFAGVPRVVEACGVLAAHGGLGTPDADELEEPRDPAAGRRGVQLSLAPGELVRLTEATVVVLARA